MVSDARLTALIASAQDEVERFTNDRFEPPSPDNDTTRRVQATGATDFLFLDRSIRSITSVTAVDYAGTATVIDSTYWRIHSSQSISGANILGGQLRDGLEKKKALTIASGTWPAPPWYIDVVGKFDWATTPEDIKHATALLAWRWARADFPPGVERIDTATSSMTIARPSPTSTGLPEADSLLKPFIRRQVGAWGVPV